jgi:hypothetical protein
LAVAGLGAGLLCLVGTMASAEDLVNDEQVAVKVDIGPLSGPGALTLTVADDEAVLTEDLTPDVAGVREFDGELPLVTVSDTRTTITGGVAWAVYGWAGDFTKDDDAAVTIPASQLGWQPVVVDDGDTGDVWQGAAVGTALDDPNAGKGLAWDSTDPDYLGELLTFTGDSAALVTADEHSWTAKADLFLRTATTVTPGNYTAGLTLALYE